MARRMGGEGTSSRAGLAGAGDQEDSRGPGGEQETRETRGQEGAAEAGPAQPAPETPQQAVQRSWALVAQDLEEAVQLAKADPRFEHGKWKIQVRPIMKVEGING